MIIIILFSLFVGCPFHQCYGANQSVVGDDIRLALQRGLSAWINKSIHTLTEKIPWNALTKANTTTAFNGNILSGALENLDNLLPERIPMIPYVIAEPTPSNILVYFGIADSYFENLNDYIFKSSVNGSDEVKYISINIHLDTSSLSGYYELDVSSYDMHLFGQGNYSVVSNDTNAAVTFSIQVFSNNSFLMTDFGLNVTIGSVQISLENLLDGDPNIQPMIDLINKMAPEMITEMIFLAQDTISEAVINFTNNIVASMLTWNDVVWIVKMLSDL